MVKPYGIIRIAIELFFDRDREVKAMRQLDFILIDLPSTYNGFLGRPFEHEYGAATSAHYYCIKFPTPRGAVGTVKGNQTMSRQCMLQTDIDLNSTHLSCIMDHVLVVMQDQSDNQTIL